MVKLLFDVGNSTCKCAEYDGDVDKLTTCLPVDVDENDVDSCIPASGSGFASVMVASVRSEAFNRRLSSVLTRKFNLQPVFVTAKRTACGVTTAYHRPGQLGVDRFLALLGAWHRCGSACIIADCGTAVTIDAINGSGVHRGGVVMPGLRLLGKALSQGTAGLPMPGAVDEQLSDDLFGCDTASAIAGGCSRILGSAVVAAIHEMQARLAVSTTLFVTGGDARGLLEVADMVGRHRPHLVLEGLAVFSDHVGDCG